MANVKLSQIASGGAVAGATDQAVIVRSGTTDLLVTPVALDTAQTWTAAQTFTNSDFKLLGSSTGATTLTSANASGTNYTVTWPAATGTVALLGLAQTWTAVQTFTNSDLKLLGSSTGATTFASANAGASNYTQTFPALTGAVQVAGAPVGVGSSATAKTGFTYLLDTVGGSTLTLPAATGSGGSVTVIVSASATSNAHKVLAGTGDYLIGLLIGEHSNTPLMFASPATTNHSLQMPFTGSQPSGGIIGDRFVLTDIAANLWEVTGVYSAGTTPTTPFSAATT